MGDHFDYTPQASNKPSYANECTEWASNVHVVFVEITHL